MFGDIFKNILVGVIGALLVALINYFAKFYKSKRLEKKFPISGQYISKYEDMENGNLVMKTAPAIFKQKGKKITGETTFDGVRKWIIEGEISFQGHIHGIYYAEDPIDKGIGNFFLKVDNFKNMTGLWSGYDSENNSITSGKYIFKPINENIEIVDIEEKFIPHIINISDNQIGNSYITKDLLNSCILNKDNYIGKVAIDTLQQKVSAFCISYTINNEDLNAIFTLNKDKIPRVLQYSNSLGFIKSIAVHEKYKGYGVGTKLIQNSIDEFCKRGRTTIFTIAWKSKESINLKGVLENLDFHNVLEIPNYWKKDSLEKQYKCPVCGIPPCECSAVIYIKTLI